MTSLANYINYRIKILKQLCIWGKLTSSEKYALHEATTENEVDRLANNYRRKYF